MRLAKKKNTPATPQRHEKQKQHAPEICGRERSEFLHGLGSPTQTWPATLLIKVSARA